LWDSNLYIECEFLEVIFYDWDIIHRNRKINLYLDLNKMKKKSIAYLLLSVFIIAACNSTQDIASTKNSGVKIERAIYRNMTGGIKGAGISSEVSVDIVVLLDNISIDSMYLQGEMIKTITSKAGHNQFFDIGEVKYNKGDTIVVLASMNKHINNNNKGINYIRYYQNEKTMKVVLDTLIKAESINQQ